MLEYAGIDTQEPAFTFQLSKFLHRSGAVWNYLFLTSDFYSCKGHTQT